MASLPRERKGKKNSKEQKRVPHLQGYRVYLGKDKRGKGEMFVKKEGRQRWKDPHTSLSEGTYATGWFE